MLFISSVTPSDPRSESDLELAIIVSPELSRKFVTSWRRNQLLQELLEKKVLRFFNFLESYFAMDTFTCLPVLWFTRCWAVLRAQQDFRT
jgi:hypothetical protein